MSLEAITWAFRQEVPGTAKLVLLALANRADDETGECWPGVTRVAKDASCSVRSAQIHIAALARNGFIEIRRMYSSADGRQRSNHYWMLFDRAPVPWKSVRDDRIDDDLDVGDGGAESAPHTDTTNEDLESGISHQDSPPPVQPASPPIKEPSESESSLAGLVQGQPIPPDAALRCQPQAVVQAQSPKAVINGSKPQGFDPKQRASRITRLQAAEDARKAEPIFVYEGSEAWQAWMKIKPRGCPVTTTTIKGKLCRGWYFPSLYPPKSTGPPNSLSPEDASALANEMAR